jgi:hypothetical protein
MPTRCGPRPSAPCTIRCGPPTLGANPAGVLSWTITSQPIYSRRTWDDSLAYHFARAVRYIA